jgi:hypothetical protein
MWTWTTLPLPFTRTSPPPHPQHDFYKISSYKRHIKHPLDTVSYCINSSDYVDLGLIGIQQIKRLNRIQNVIKTVIRYPRHIVQCNKPPSLSDSRNLRFIFSFCFYASLYCWVTPSVHLNYCLLLRLSLWPWYKFHSGNHTLRCLLTSNRCISVKQKSLYWNAIVSCEWELILLRVTEFSVVLYLVRAVHTFVSRFVTNVLEIKRTPPRLQCNKKNKLLIQALHTHTTFQNNLCFWHDLMFPQQASLGEKVHPPMISRSKPYSCVRITTWCSHDTANRQYAEILKSQRKTHNINTKSSEEQNI